MKASATGIPSSERPLPPTPRTRPISYETDDDQLTEDPTVRVKRNSYIVRNYIY